MSGSSKFKNLEVKGVTGQGTVVSESNNLIEFEEQPASPPQNVTLVKNKVTKGQVSAGLKTKNTQEGENDPEVPLTWNETKKGYEIPKQIPGFEWGQDNNKVVKKPTPVDLKWYFKDKRNKKTDKVDITYYINDNGKKIGNLTITLDKQSTPAIQEPVASVAATPATSVAAPVAAPVATPAGATPVASTTPAASVAATPAGAEITQMLEEIKFELPLKIKGFGDEITEDTFKNLFEINDGKVGIKGDEVDKVFKSALNDLEVSVIKTDEQGNFVGIERKNFSDFSQFKTINDLKEPIVLKETSQATDANAANTAQQATDANAVPDATQQATDNANTAQQATENVNKLENLKNGLKELFQSKKDKAKELIQKVSSLKPLLNIKPGEKIETQKQNLITAFDTMINDINNISVPDTQILKSELESIKENISKAKEDTIGTVTNKIRGTITEVEVFGQTLLNQAQGAVEQTISNAGQNIQEQKQKLGENAQELMQSAAALKSKLTNTAGESIEEQKQKLDQALNKTIEKINNISSQVPQSLRDKINSIKQDINTAKEDTIGTVTNKIRGTITDVEVFGKTLLNQAEGAVGQAQGAVEQAQGAAEQAQGAVGQTITKADEAISNAGEAAKQLGIDAKKKAKTLIDSLKDKIDNIKSSSGNSPEVETGLIKEIENNLNDLKDTVKTDERFVNFFNKMNEKINEAKDNASKVNVIANQEITKALNNIKDKLTGSDGQETVFAANILTDALGNKVNRSTVELQAVKDAEERLKSAKTDSEREDAQQELNAARTALKSKGGKRTKRRRSKRVETKKNKRANTKKKK